MPDRRRSAILYSIAAVAAFFITVSHRPDSMLNPQFWAEDGKMWYQQAYNNGVLVSLFTPEAGYFQTISRLVAGLSQLASLAYAPYIFNFAAISAKVIVVLFILSSRLEKSIPSVWVRAILAFIYLCLPHSFETTANLTNVQWHLALLCFLVIIAVPSKKVAWRVFDISVVAISAFSGPFCLLLVPVVSIKFYMTREKRLIPLISILLVASVVQITSLILFERPSRQPLGAELGLFFQIVGGHLFFDSIFGDKNYGRLIKLGWWTEVSAFIVCIFGFAAVGYAFLRAELDLRLFVLFSALIVAGALISPAVSSDMPQWQAMLPEIAGSRYWMIPIFCFFACLITIAAKSDLRPVRYATIAVLFMSLVGIVADWKHPRFNDLRFPEYVESFERATPGQEVVIPINPNWEMRLIKK